VRGRLVKPLVRDTKEAGFHDVTWWGDDTSGRRVSPGVYFSRLATPARTESRRIVKIR